VTTMRPSRFRRRRLKDKMDATWQTYRVG